MEFETEKSRLDIKLKRVAIGFFVSVVLIMLSYIAAYAFIFLHPNGWYDGYTDTWTLCEDARVKVFTDNIDEPFKFSQNPGFFRVNEVVWEYESTKISCKMNIWSRKIISFDVNGISKMDKVGYCRLRDCE